MFGFKIKVYGKYGTYPFTRLKDNFSQTGELHFGGKIKINYC